MAWLGGAPSPPAEPLSVEVSGCARISKGPVCHLDPNEPLHLWLPGTVERPVDVRLNAAPVQVETSTTARGLRAWVPRPVAGALTVVDVEGRRWQLELELETTPPELEDARRWAERGDAAALRRLEGSEPRVRAEVELLLARLDRRRGAFRDALDHQARSAQIAEDAGEWSLLAKARFARAYALAFDVFEIDAARRELRLLEGLDRRVPEVSAYRPYYRALLSLQVSDLAAANQDLRLADRRARELGLDELVRFVEERRAAIDVELGDFDSASARLRPILEWARTSNDPCLESAMATNLGWALLLQRRQQRGAADDPKPALRRALELWTGPCPSRRDVANARVNLAFAALQARDFDEARSWLEAVEPEHLPAQSRLDYLEGEARIALASGRLAEASALARRLVMRARATARPSDIYRGLVLAAEVAEGQGRWLEARRARVSAEKALDELSVQVPLVGARHAFLAARDDNVRRLTALWLREGRPRAAIDAIRRARSRSLGWARVSQALSRLPREATARWNALIGEYRRVRRDLDRDLEQEWGLAASELKAARARREQLRARLDALLAEALDLLPAAPQDRSPEPGVLDLGWIRLRDRVVLWGSLGSDAFSHSLGSEAELEDLPGPVGRRLERASRVRLHPYGSLGRRDLHMVRWGGEPLAALVPTVYALDLDFEPADRPIEAALVLIDPAGNLERADEEARLVVDALTAQALSVDYAGRWTPDVEATRQRIAVADWFHFGGHGSWTPDDPLSGGLALGGGTRLGIGDILTLPRAPSVVVMTSCEAGRSAGRGGESVGIAHAFAIAGAQLVVAPSRPVSDVDAFRFAEAFYRASGSVLGRYREAMSRLGASAAAFRVYEP